MKKRNIALALAFALLILLPGCGKNTEPEETVSAEPPATAVPTPTPATSAETAESEEPYSGPYNPLTGLPIDEAHAGCRPFAIMLNNIEQALPQQGNSQADIIYEAVAEGGITRMLAVYQSVEGVPAIGSIRSARPYYIELALGHNAVYVHAGGSEEAYSDLSNWGVDDMDGVNGRFSSAGAGVFWRDKNRIAGKTFDYEHSLLTSGEKLESAVSNYGISMEHTSGYDCGLTFADDGTPQNGEAATQISVPFSGYKTGKFTYDSATSLYMVQEYGEAYVDGNDGSQVSVTNVFVLRASVYSSGDSYGHMRISLDGGDGWYACGGKIIPISWSKADRNSPIKYYNTDGSPLTLGRGRSYVNIIAKENTVTYS